MINLQVLEVGGYLSIPSALSYLKYNNIMNKRGTIYKDSRNMVDGGFNQSFAILIPEKQDATLVFDKCTLGERAP